MRIFTTLACLLAPCAAHNTTSRIVDAANVDGIDLYSLPLAAQALASVSIQDIYGAPNISIPPGIIYGNKFDVHMHVVPSWYRTAVPFVGGFPTPNWTLEAHLSFMASAGIKHGVLSMGTPGSVVYPRDPLKFRRSCAAFEWVSRSCMESFRRSTTRKQHRRKGPTNTTTRPIALYQATLMSMAK
jgi:hypothetical protein